MKRFHKIAVTIVIGLLAAPIILYAYYVLTLGPFPTPKEGALYAELEAVQTAMNVMMVDRSLTSVDGHTSGPAVNEWTGTLDIYLGKSTTKYYYCWDARGEVYALSEAPDVAENPGECRQKP